MQAKRLQRKPDETRGLKDATNMHDYYFFRLTPQRTDEKKDVLGEGGQRM